MHSASSWGDRVVTLLTEAAFRHPDAFFARSITRRLAIICAIQSLEVRLCADYQTKMASELESTCD